LETFPAEIGFEEFVQKFHENPREIFDRLLKITWDLKEETIAVIQRKDDYKERLKKKEAQIQSLVEERDDYRPPSPVCPCNGRAILDTVPLSRKHQ
jgi:hypothetical protein